jgi:hypothetical protein
VAFLNEARCAALRHAAPRRECSAGRVDPSRRRFVINAAFGVIGAGLPAAAADAAAVEPADLVLRRYTVPIRGLSPALAGLRILHLSDTHLGPGVPESLIRRAVRLALERRPDLVVLTGDYIRDGTSCIDRAADLFAPLAGPGGARLGALAVLGNHDHHGDAARMRSALERVGVRVVDNDRHFLDARTMSWTTNPPLHARDEPRSAAMNPVVPGMLCVAGLGDLDEGVIDTASAFAGVPGDTPRVLLCHQPDTVEHPRVRRLRIDLALCGHTHGGQVSLPIVGAPIVPSRFGDRYVGGLARGPGGAVVISRGIGTSLLPVRWNVPPEVVEVTLA